MAFNLGNTGLEVHDLHRSPAFLRRRLRPRNALAHLEGLWRLCHAFLHTPDNLLQELTDTALYLCGADSAGVSIEQGNGGEQHFWLWAAVSGQFARFAHCTLPRYPSACGECLRQGCPQTLRVSRTFYDLMQIQAEPVTDGILIPWHVGASRGTIWILAHGRDVAFDRLDLDTLQMLAGFTAIARRRHLQQTLAAEPAEAEAITDMATRILGVLDRFHHDRADRIVAGRLIDATEEAASLTRLLRERIQDFYGVAVHPETDTQVLRQAAL